MKQDIGVISGVTLAIGVVMWAFVGNPQGAHRTRTSVSQNMDVAPELKRVTEHSPYMRSER